MKCCSRSTLGVVIGILNLLVYIALALIAIAFLTHKDADVPDSYLQRNDIARTKTLFSVLIVMSLTMVIISGIFIMGIVKRRHKLMIPWLLLSGIGFVLNCGRFVFDFFGAVFAGASFFLVLTILIVGVVSIGLSALILWTIFTLYGDIRKKNIEQTGKIIAGDEMAYNMPKNY